VSTLAYHARLDVAGKDGKTTGRMHLVGLARRYREQGKHDAALQAKADEIEEELAGPRSPPALQYLLEWLEEVYGRSGTTMDGLAPLSWSCLDSWARMTQRDPTHAELLALLLLDATKRNPPPESKHDG